MAVHDLIVIGAGPAGMFAAARVAAAGRRVLLLEKQPEPGRKLLLSGSGQCNFTNAQPVEAFLAAYGEHGRFLKPALLHFTNQDAIAYFDRRGVAAVTVAENGKVFPKSRRACDILEALVLDGLQHGVTLRFRERVGRLAWVPSGGFRVTASTGDFNASKVLVATGGKSYPSTGSTGDGYAWARALGHTVVEPRPGLAPFHIKAFPLGDLAGTGLKHTRVTLWRSGKKVSQRTGDLLLTHHGLSGPVIHNLSRYAQPGDRVTIALVACETSETAQTEWLAQCEKNAREKAGAWLKRYPLTQGLARKVLEFAEVPADQSLGQLNRDKRLGLWQGMTAFPLEIEALGDFNVAMVTCGGVALDEINPKTMESRLISGLYFAGEVMDIDGDSGGYDLQAAWSTAALAAHAILRSLIIA